MIQDGCKIGQKGFGFIPINNKNIKFPHIGKVVIEDEVEIASNCTIDRGSIDNTKLEKILIWIIKFTLHTMFKLDLIV